MYSLLRTVSLVFSNSIIGRQCRSSLLTFFDVRISFSYNKTENLSIDELLRFDYLLVESTNDEDKRLAPYLSRSFRILDFVRAFNGFYFDQQLFFLRMRWIPKIYLLEKKRIE